jgi:hypothetical protein
MANIQSRYARLTQVVVNAGNPETRLLSQGTQNTDFTGSLTFPSTDRLTRGDIIRVTAWGYWESTNPQANGTARIRLYFNDGGGSPPAALVGPVIDLTAQINVGAAGSWWFHAYMTKFTNVGTGVNFAVDGFIEDVQNPTNFNKMTNSITQFRIDPTVDNYVELTALVSTMGRLTITQCSMEYLPSAT